MRVDPTGPGSDFFDEVERDGSRSSGPAIRHPGAVTRPAPAGAGIPAPPGTRRLHFPSIPEGCVCPVYAREAVPIGVRLEGPCVMEEDFSTTLVHPGQSVVRHAAGHLVIELP